MTIDTHLFIDIILNEGAQFLYYDSVGEDHIEYYHGITGRKVAISIDDSFISKNVAVDHLNKLGLGDLVDRIPFV